MPPLRIFNDAGKYPCIKFEKQENNNTLAPNMLDSSEGERNMPSH